MCRSIGARAGFVSADDERRPPTEAALLRLAVKGRDLTVALPKFYVMTIDELPCVFFFAVSSSGNTSSIALLIRPSSSRMYARYSAICGLPALGISEHRNHFLSVRSPTPNFKLGHCGKTHTHTAVPNV